MTCSPDVLIVSNHDDFASDFLVLKLISLGVPYIRVNSEDIKSWNIVYDFNNPINIKYDDFEYKLDSIKGVYFRRAPSVYDHFADTLDFNFLSRECKEFYEGLYCNLNTKWMNPIFETYKSERKLFQLKVAKNIGFDIPQSIVTNDPKIVKDFIKKRPCIIKPISHGLQVRGSEAYSIYTNAISQNIEIDNEALFECPLYLQEKIHNDLDIRITVVGNKVFPVGIKKKNSCEVDWRRPDQDKDYCIIDLPRSIINKCIKLNKLLNLTYSAIDMIKSKDNSYIFLEVNPAGEWVWLENELDIPISNTIISELLN